MSATIDVSEGLLFPVFETLSPRMAWMRQHRITTWRTVSEIVGETSPETGDEIAAWYAARLGREAGMIQGPVCGGTTETDAITELAVKLRLKLWNEEGA